MIFLSEGIQALLNDLFEEGIQALLNDLFAIFLICLATKILVCSL